MKVLYISPNGYLGGAEKFVVNIVKEHKKNSNYIPIVLFFSDGRAKEILGRESIKTYLLPFKLRFRKVWTFVHAVLIVRRIIKKENIQIVHSTMPYSHIVVFFAALFLNVKKVWFQHGPVGGMLDYIANFMSSDVILFNSEYLKREHLKMPQLFKPKFGYHVVSCGVDIVEVDDEEVKNIRSKYLGGKEFLLMSAGRISPAKGYETIIEAIRVLRDFENDLFRKLKVLIIGNAPTAKDIIYEEKLLSLIKNYHLKSVIELIGFKDDVQKYYKASDIFLHTTNICESFGLVVAEAMSQETLVIGSSMGGTRELIEDGVTGFSFDTTSKKAHEDLFEIIKIALSKPYEEIKIEALRRIKKNHSLDTSTKKIEDIYDSLTV